MVKGVDAHTLLALLKFVVNYRKLEVTFVIFGPRMGSGHSKFEKCLEMFVEREIKNIGRNLPQQQCFRELIKFA